MFLSDRDIIDSIEKGEIKIDPFEIQNVQAGSVDLRLGNDFLVLDYHAGAGVIKFGQEPIYQRKEGEIIIPANEFILGTTLEYLCIPPNMIASVQGRSSIGRRGLFVQNAGWIDPGFKGNLTLELFNPNALPIQLKPGMRICQVFFGYTKTPSEHPYDGKYLGQEGVTGSRSYQDEI